MACCAPLALALFVLLPAWRSLSGIVMAVLLVGLLLAVALSRPVAGEIEATPP